MSASAPQQPPPYTADADAERETGADDSGNGIVGARRRNRALMSKDCAKCICAVIALLIFITIIVVVDVLT